VVGVNYYPYNQWFYDEVDEGVTIDRFHPLYRPFRAILQEVYARYRRPLFVAETGAEGGLRRDWLRYVAAEVRAALRAGVPLEGICLYPILNHPGWNDDRHCHNGLWDYVDEAGDRAPYRPLALELARQQRMIERMQPRSGDRANGRIAAGAE
jgi:hypothetical protein